jgi:hypothetical protein
MNTNIMNGQLLANSMIGKRSQSDNRNNDNNIAGYLDYRDGITNHPLVINRDSHKILIHSIAFEKSIDIYKIKELSIEIGGAIIFNIDFKLLLNISKINWKYNIVYIPDNLIFPNKDFFYMSPVIFTNIIIKLNSDNNTINYRLR